MDRRTHLKALRKANINQRTNRRIDKELASMGNNGDKIDYTKKREKIIDEMKKGVAKNYPVK